MNLATAWLRLSQRFPDVYVGEATVRDGVAELNAEIERNLTKLSSKPAGKAKPSGPSARRVAAAIHAGSALAAGQRDTRRLRRRAWRG